jgi:hypothetical protein
MGSTWSRDMSFHIHCSANTFCFWGQWRDSNILSRQDCGPKVPDHQWPDLRPNMELGLTIKRWIFMRMPFQNSCWNLIFIITILRGGAHQRWFRTLMNGLMSLSKEWVSYHQSGLIISGAFSWSLVWSHVCSLSLLPYNNADTILLDFPASRTISQINFYYL